MPISIEKTDIEGLTIVKPHIFEDERGYFIKDFDKEVFEKNGIPSVFFESDESKSQKGTIRGLHFQRKYSQGKLIRVIKGAVYDVAVDLRFDSPTFGCWRGFEISEYNHNVLFVPKGFAHGFLALEDDTIFSYKCTERYAPEYDDGIKFDDEDININWPFDLIGGKEKRIVSVKDLNLQSFKEFIKKKERIL